MARRPGPDADSDPLDPMARQTAQLGPPPGLGRAGPSADASQPGGSPEPRPRASVEDLLPMLVRRVAWSGDGRRGAVRLELGSGALAGAELVIESDEGRVRVQLRGPGGLDLAPWRERIARRLAARGLDVQDVAAEG